MSVKGFYSDGELPSLSLDEGYAGGVECSLEYLNEGGANFVFGIRQQDESKAPPQGLKGKLLRLRKDLPHVQTAAEQLSAFRENFQDLFPAENLVQHELVKLDSALLAKLNETLRTLDRPAHRLRDSLPVGEQHGLLVTDMGPAIDDVLLQIKPKWLAQSPSAPPDAKRCRTCALRAQRASERIRTATDAQQSCPLELISEQIGHRERAAESMVQDPMLRDYLVHAAQPLLELLRQSQLRLDVKGTLNTFDGADILQLCKAMTLRDCTLFLRRSGQAVEARLADLDLKQPEKLAGWTKVEAQLIKCGWYTNTEQQSVWSKEARCLLSREKGV